MSFTILQADSHRIPLAAKSVQCVVTSPPYWGLRDYGAIGQIGLEPTPEEYVAKIVAVFEEVKRVLRDDGVCFVNLRSSYFSSSGRERQDAGVTDGASVSRILGKASGSSALGDFIRSLRHFKPKDLVNIPFFVAEALRLDGWYLRSTITWCKKNPMPESVTDRPTKATEMIFLLSKSPRYFYDSDAVRQDNANLRDWWEIATEPFPGSHFAVFPEEIAVRCIKAGTSEKGACKECGAPWERVLASGEVGGTHRERTMQNTYQTLGWQPTCKHNYRSAYTSQKPCIVLDPFSGAGTVPLVADKLNRRGIGLELKSDYCRMAHDRCYDDAPLLAVMEG